MTKITLIRHDNTFASYEFCKLVARGMTKTAFFKDNKVEMTLKDGLDLGNVTRKIATVLKNDPAWQNRCPVDVITE